MKEVCLQNFCVQLLGSVRRGFYCVAAGTDVDGVGDCARVSMYWTRYSAIRTCRVEQNEPQGPACKSKRSLIHRVAFDDFGQTGNTLLRVLVFFCDGFNSNMLIGVTELTIRKAGAFKGADFLVRA